MIVWLWSSGQSAGVTDELGKARAAAGGCMAIGGTAVVEPAYYVDGTSAVTTGYAPSGGMRYAGAGEQVEEKLYGRSAAQGAKCW